MSSIGVIGVGMVGGAVARYYEEKGWMVVKEDPKFGLPPQYDKIMGLPLVFVCVPTPTSEQNQQDLTYVVQVLSKLQAINYPGIVVLKSTVLMKTCDKLQETYPQLRLVHNPEFLREKTAYEDFVDQKAVVLSGPDARAAAAYAYEPVGLPCICVDDFKMTEFAKYAHNCGLALKVAMANQLYLIAAKLGISYEESIKLAIAQEMLGKNHMKVPGDHGLGYSGACFPKDMRALITWLMNNELLQEGSLFVQAEAFNNWVRSLEASDPDQTIDSGN